MEKLSDFDASQAKANLKDSTITNANMILEIIRVTSQSKTKFIYYKPLSDKVLDILTKKGFEIETENFDGDVKYTISW